MIDQLATTAKQAGLELIALSDTLADTMQTWGDVLAHNPNSVTATFSAGFINKPTAATELEMVIDVQAPPDQPAVIRTWAIQTKTSSDHKEYFNNIQLTFETDSQQAHSLTSKGKAITREDIRTLLQSAVSRLANITVTHESAGDGPNTTPAERYDFSASQLSKRPDEAPKISRALQAVLQALKKSL